MEKLLSRVLVLVRFFFFFFFTVMLGNFGVIVLVVSLCHSILTLN